VKLPFVSRPTPNADVAARLDKIEREMKAIGLEWEEYFDKFRRLYGRLSKRISDSQDNDRQQERGTVAPPLDDTSYAAHQARALQQSRTGKAGR
jgi:hypothetical protein